MKRIIGGFLLVAASSFAMADDGWIPAASNDQVEFSIKKKSGEITKNKAGDDIFVVVGRVLDKKSGKINLEKWYVKYSDCLNKQGQIVTLTLGGDYQYENDFVFGAGSIASSNAELICAGYEYVINKNNEKGI